MALNTKDFGRLFVVTLDPERIRPGTPLFHLAPSWEMESPFRESPLTVVIRPNRLLKRGLIIGWWRDTAYKTLDEVEVGMGMIAPGDLMSNLSDEDKDQVRKTIARSRMSIDEELELMQMMDVL